MDINSVVTEDELSTESPSDTRRSFPADMTRSNKGTTKAEIERRVNVIVDCIAKRMRRAEILRYIKETPEGWQCSSAMADRYIRKARESIVQIIDRDRRAYIAEAIFDLDHLYRKALNEEDFSTALQVRKEKNKLLSLSSIVKEEIFDKVKETERPELPKIVSDMIKDIARVSTDEEAEQRKQYGSIRDVDIF